MTVTFKHYLKLMNLSESASEEQINEIFGAFFGGKEKPEQLSKDQKLAKLKAERDRLEALRKAKRAELDKQWAAAKARIERGEDGNERKVGSQTVRPTGRTSLAAQGRAAELDWIANLK